MKKGDKVLLPANEKEGWPEEKGTVVEVSDKVVTVQVDKEYIKEDDDDGLRECLPGDVKPLKTSKKKPINQVTTKTNKKMKTPAKKSAKSVSATAKKAAKGAAKKTAKKAAKKVAKKVAKKTASRPAAKRSDTALTRKEAAAKLKISIYAVDQALLKKELKSLEESDVMKYKKTH